MDPAAYLASRGVLYRRSFLAAGFTVAQYRRLAAEHLLVRRGVVVHREAPPALRTAASLGGALTCASAAEPFGLWLRDSSPALHLSFTAGHSGRSSSGLIRHRRFGDRPLAADPVLPLPEVCAHALSCLPPNDSVALVESAVVLHGLSLSDVRPLLGHRHGAGALSALNDVRGDAGSIIEVHLRRVLDSMGLRYETQVLIPGVGRVDFLVEGFLIIETDGWQWHGNREQWRRDMDRDTASLGDGYVSLRFRAEQVWSAPEYVRSSITSAFERFRWLLRNS
ncbi:endonuclease domain-containing protein [Zhihengliuella halotolerans]|uniref:endonuclease domain-containing protein n=1 Tax=Zhihengliuella halotolerans TaxID=370736 RepID=UPI000C80F8B5|nr:DUF559 domain-containing protein [Zhihengliuella halotolerans]